MSRINGHQCISHLCVQTACLVLERFSLGHQQGIDKDSESDVMTEVMTLHLTIMQEAQTTVLEAFHVIAAGEVAGRKGSFGG